MSEKCPYCEAETDDMEFHLNHVHSVNTNDLREFIDELREEPGLHNPEYVTDQMEYSVQKRLADELEELISK